MKLYGFDKYEVVKIIHKSYITEESKTHRPTSLTKRVYDGGELMLYIANELNKDNCIAVECDCDNSTLKFCYITDTGDTDYETAIIRKVVD